MKIASNELKFSEDSQLFKITETLRNNKYKLSNFESEQIIMGEDLCDNSNLINKIRKIDVYTVAYNTGFNHGRKYSKSIMVPQKKDENKSDGPIDLKVIQFRKTRIS